ncbi:glycosyltransferase [Planctomycetota bacterium]|nr:glycosyltransferase [Planctomycetota bacterium]
MESTPSQIPSSIHITVFSDDWAQHPSSSQHLITELLTSPQYHDKIASVLWVNTTGTRPVHLSIADLKKIARKLKNTYRSPANQAPATQTSIQPNVINPMMYPGFRKPWQRALNKKRLTDAVLNHWRTCGIHPSQPNTSNTQRVVLTTLPITADLVDTLPAKWVYYCVDDFSVWPGCDHRVMDQMERQLVSKVDQIITVSSTLKSRILSMDRTPQLLTHGIHLNHWVSPHTALPLTSELSAKRNLISQIGGPVFLFWGLIDQRLDLDFVEQLAYKARSAGGQLVLVGPEAKPNPRLHQLAGETARGLAIPALTLLGNIPYQYLPHFAHAADVLVMPYINAPVTHAMQPLKLKEYLATNKPVICRNLPSTHAWIDACDLADTPESFADIAMLRAHKGTTTQQIAARHRLQHESWSEKASVFMSIIAPNLVQAPSHQISLAA